MGDHEARHTLIVGGTGFAGRRLAFEMAGHGWSVSVTSRSRSSMELSAASGLRIAVSSWTGDIETLRDIMREARTDVVVVLAALFVAEHSPEDVDPLIRANVRLPAVVLEAARLAGITRVVTAGTFWEERSTEDTDAVDLYAATRRAAKELLRYYVGAYGWKAAHVRVPDVYGPEDPRQKLFSLLRAASRERSAIAMSPGEQFVELLHVADAASGFRHAVEETLSPGRGLLEFGLFPDAPIRLRDLVATYESVIGRSIDVDWGARPYRFREVMRPVRLAGPPGWRPAYDLVSGIEDMERGPGGLLAQ